MSDTATPDTDVDDIDTMHSVHCQCDDCNPDRRHDDRPAA